MAFLFNCDMFDRPTKKLVYASMKTLSSPKVLVMKFLWFAIFSFVCQASSDARNTTTLQRRQCAKDPATGQWNCDFNLPTLQEIVQRYRDPNNEGAATADRPVWFYTNLDLAGNSAASLAFCKGWMLSNQLDGYYVASGLDLEWYHEQFDWIQEHRQQFVFGMAGLDPEVIFGDCLFEAVALSALHPEAYVFTKEAPEFWSMGSTWAKVEYPALTSNSNVQRIYRVDPHPGHCNQRQLIWDRSRDPVLRTIETCPVLPPILQPQPPISQSQSASRAANAGSN